MTLPNVYEAVVSNIYKTITIDSICVVLTIILCYTTRLYGVVHDDKEPILIPYWFLICTGLLVIYPLYVIFTIVITTVKIKILYYFHLCRLMLIYNQLQTIILTVTYFKTNPGIVGNRETYLLAMKINNVFSLLICVVAFVKLTTHINYKNE